MYVRQFICRPYTIRILRKYRKFTLPQLWMTLQWHPSGTTPWNLALHLPGWSGFSAYAEAFTSHSQQHWLTRYSQTSVVCTCMTTDLWCLIFTVWRSSANIAIILGYKWNTKSIFFLPNILPVYSEMALSAVILHLLHTWWHGHDIAACWN